MNIQVFSIFSKLSLLTSLLEGQAPFKQGHLQLLEFSWSPSPPLLLISLPGLPFSHILWKPTPFKTHYKCCLWKQNSWSLSWFLFLQLQIDVPFSFSLVKLYSTYVHFFMAIILICLVGEAFLKSEAHFSAAAHTKSECPGTPLVVLWLRLCVPTAGCKEGFDPWLGN